MEQEPRVLGAFPGVRIKNVAQRLLSWYLSIYLSIEVWLCYGIEIDTYLIYVMGEVIYAIPGL